jgi:hypothetical protein
MVASIQLDRSPLIRLRPGAFPTRHGTIKKKAAILEKLEEVLWFTVAHVRTEPGAHQNLA